MKLNKLSTLALAGVFALGSACGDDGPAAASGDVLTVAEFESMSAAFGDLGGAVFTMIDLANLGGGPGAGFAADQIAAQLTGTFSASGSCPAGGTAAITGGYTITGENSASVTVTQTMDNCALVSADEEVWTFNSEPNIRWTASATKDVEDNFTFTATQNGRFSWAGNEKQGECQIGVTLTVTGNLASSTVQIEVDGSVCGQSFEATFEYTPPAAG